MYNLSGTSSYLPKVHGGKLTGIISSEFGLLQIPALPTSLYVALQLLSHVSSLRPHGQQHTRLPYSPLSPRVCSNSCLLTW